MLNKKTMMAVLCALAIAHQPVKADDNTPKGDGEFTPQEETDFHPDPNDKTVREVLAPVMAKAPDWTKDVADRIKLHGYAQGAYIFNNANGENSNSFNMKRVIFWVDARITERWSFSFMHDFSSVVQEYYTDFSFFKNKKYLTVRFGQFKHGYSYENPLSPTSMETVDVYSEGVTYLAGCGSDRMFGTSYGREMGLALFGEAADGKFAYNFQVLNGCIINKIDNNNQKDMVLRLEYRPVKGLNIVATGQLGRGQNELNYRSLLTDVGEGERYIRNRYSVGGAYDCKWIRLHGEYLEGKDGTCISRGGYLTGSVPLGLKGFESVFSYDYFNYNVARGYDQHKAVVGLQYWFFKKCRVQAQYVYKSATVNSGATSFDQVYVSGANHGVQVQLQVRFN